MMSYMKRNIENRIDALAHKAGYPYEALFDIFLNCLSEADQDGIPFDWAQFQGVAMEHDF